MSTPNPTTPTVPPVLRPAVPDTLEKITDPTVLCVLCDHPAVCVCDEDEYCAACFARIFEQCWTCGAWVGKDEILSCQTSPQTLWEPAEYDSMCIRCYGDPTDDYDDRDFDDCD